jgi:ATP-dependent exoDNAse (exonuclease V) alpha subunit
MPETSAPAPPTTLTPEARFHALASSGKNVFLTGPAGTGKTHQQRDWLDRNPRAAVTASTGVAALNAGGATVHRWSGIMIGPSPGQSFDSFFRQLSQESRFGIRAAFNRVRQTEQLVIDEISMLPGRLLDYLDFHCRTIRKDDRPFGGIQVISTGDFLQLPCVRTDPRAEYDWAFDSEAWRNAGFQTVELTTIRRQDDREFAGALSRFRVGEIDRRVADVLRPRVANFPNRELTRLLTHNVQVDKWNDYCLADLPGEEWVREAETDGPPSQIAFLTKNLLTPAFLRLKQGARVMFTVNRPDDGFVNGQTGTVARLGRHEVVVETGGELVTVEPFTWTFDPKDETSASFTQFPLRLAYAMTIHRAQGLTLDSAFIDIRAAREPGQGYVALSRVRSVDGLHLKDWPRGVFVSQRAIDFHATTCR